MRIEGDEVLRLRGATGGAEHIVGWDRGCACCLVVVPSEDAEPVAAGAPAGAPLESKTVCRRSTRQTRRASYGVSATIRGFSAMKLIKTDVRNRLTVNVLTDVLRIKLMSPSISDLEPTDAIHAWNVTSLTQTKLPNCLAALAVPLVMLVYQSRRIAVATRDSES